jgi:hypothetical protein
VSLRNRKSDIEGSHCSLEGLAHGFPSQVMLPNDATEANAVRAIITSGSIFLELQRFALLSPRAIFEKNDHFANLRTQTAVV